MTPRKSIPRMTRNVVVIKSLKKWRHYLIPKEFVLYNDNHQALQFITKQEKLNQKHAKQVEFM
jgi:hypothetical protein